MRGVLGETVERGHIGVGDGDGLDGVGDEAEFVALEGGEAALAKLLPGAWRPARALMRQGRVTATGIELPPGGEIWLQVPRLVSKFAGTATPASPTERARVIGTWGSWYKGGRLQAYKSPSPKDAQDGSESFQAWSAETGGWLVISTGDNPDLATVVVRVLEVEERG